MKAKDFLCLQGLPPKTWIFTENFSCFQIKASHASFNDQKTHQKLQVGASNSEKTCQSPNSPSPTNLFWLMFLTDLISNPTRQLWDDNPSSSILHLYLLNFTHSICAVTGFKLLQLRILKFVTHSERPMFLPKSPSSLSVPPKSWNYRYPNSG